MPDRAREPKVAGWRLVRHTPEGAVWARGRFVVVSELVQAELPDGSGTGPQWLVSVSYKRRRPDNKQVQRALRAFGMAAAEEDNHEPGIARKFWLPVDPAHRVDCECKTTEDVIVEPDGFKWSNPKPESGEACRGCAHELVFGRPCPLHGEVAACP